MPSLCHNSKTTPSRKLSFGTVMEVMHISIHTRHGFLTPKYNRSLVWSKQSDRVGWKHCIVLKICMQHAGEFTSVVQQATKT